MISYKTVPADLEGLALKIDQEIMKEGCGCTLADHYDTTRDGVRLFVANYIKSGLLGKPEMAITLSYIEAAGKVTLVSNTSGLNKGAGFKKGTLVENIVLSGIEKACDEYAVSYTSRKQTRGKHIKVNLPRITKRKR